MQDNEYSFAKGGKSFAHMKPENFDLNTSSIDQKLDEDIGDIQEFNGNSKAMREKVDRMETELEEFRSLHNALKFQNETLKGDIKQLKAS